MRSGAGLCHACRRIQGQLPLTHCLCFFVNGYIVGLGESSVFFLSGVVSLVVMAPVSCRLVDVRRNEFWNI
eukprot:2142196-Lingulodinium_polyedra.AAC.1